MAEKGIKDKVAIVGMGCTKFGELWEKGVSDLIVESYKEALEDAGIEPKDIEAAWQGNLYDFTAVSAMPLSTTLKLPFIPVTRVENMCASGSEALRGACYAVAAGIHDVCLALGVEKLKDTGYGGLPAGGGGAGVGPNATAPGMFAMMATRYFAKYGLSPEEGKRTLAHISSKSHHNGTLNPKAHLQREISIEDIMRAPIIAWPLGLFDCCGVSDGSAAAIVVRADMAKNFRPDPVYVKSLQIAVSSGEESAYTDYDYAHVESTYHAGIRAYEEAGIKNPREEVSMMEVHDCFSITELVTYEDLQISPRGRAGEDINAGFYDLDGQVPCQPDGGLKCFGHPIGASGLRMMYEMYKQLQGKAGPRQMKDPKVGLTHNLGGVPPRCVCSVCMVGL
ncbi:MAG: acetyl-CoA acetyltransferase [Dehalococcoidia bacterium]|jgi:acetyl-CoA C-acetyltransferase|nr:acetyl-CoA acetyltransferase [Dehalococcoidia bacterium]